MPDAFIPTFVAESCVAKGNHYSILLSLKTDLAQFVINHLQCLCLGLILRLLIVSLYFLIVFIFIIRINVSSQLWVINEVLNKLGKVMFVSCCKGIASCSQKLHRSVGSTLSSRRAI